METQVLAPPKKSFSFIGWLRRLWKLLKFTDVDINVAGFDNTNLIPAYKDPGTRQWGSRLANNTGYNNRRSDQNLFIENDLYTSPSEDKTYDTDRDYRNKYFKFEIGDSATAFTMPLGLNSVGDTLTTEWIQLTTSFQALPFTGSIQVQALNTGGFTLRVTAAANRYVLGSVTELRLVTGS